MRKLQVLTAVIVVVLFFALLGALIWWGFGGIRNVFAQLETETAIVLGAVSLVILIAAGWVAGSIRGLALARGRLGRAIVYKQLLDAIAQADDLTPPGHALILSASPSVLHAYGAYREGTEGDDDDRPRAERFHRLVLAMRRDLGNSTYGFERKDSLSWLSE